MMVGKRNMTLGGVVLLAIWGGVGFFMGKGKNKNNAKNPATKQVVKREEPKQRPKVVDPKVAVRKAPASKIVKASVRQAPPAAKRQSFTYVLRLRYIYPVSLDGKVSPKNVSLEDLLLRGREAQKAKEELFLKVRGDARARWLEKVKRTLRERNIPFRIKDDF